MYTRGMTTSANQWPDLNTVPETALILRISKMTVYRMIHAGDFGEGGVIRVGRSFRIKSTAINHVIATGTQRGKDVSISA